MLNLIYIEHKPTFTLFAARIGRAVCLLNLVSGLAADKLRAAMAYLLYGDTASWSLYDFIYIARVQTMNSTSMPRDNRALRITLTAARKQIQKKNQINRCYDWDCRCALVRLYLPNGPTSE